MPNLNDDNDHTITVPAATTTVSVGPTSTLIANPTDHPDRPINSKPTGTDDEVKEPTKTGSPVSSTTSKPTSTALSSHANWLPSFFPTFGVSAKTQTWIYGSIGLILLFCISLSVYLFLARRKRLRNASREDYEFDLIDEDEAEGLTRGGNAQAGKKTKRRAGELYDAFADGSDDDVFSDDDEDTHELAYKDSHHVIGDDEESVEGGDEKEISEKR